MNFNLPVEVKGHLHIKDDLGNILVDKNNAIHPQNMARVFARALSNESNFFIHRIAYGNGGTETDAAFNISYNKPNDGQDPDTRTFDSRLYNETYSEIIDEGRLVLNPTLGQDPGSAGPNVGTRVGGGANPNDDPPTSIHVSGPSVTSNELGLLSEVVITSVLNPNEPEGQFVNDNLFPSENTETDFFFDEIGLYTSGAPAISSSGYQNVDVSNRTSIDDTGLFPNTNYQFQISVDGSTSQLISLTTPVSGGSGSSGAILYGDLCEAINTGDTNWGFTGVSPLPLGASISITDTSAVFPTIIGVQTFGFLVFQSSSTGVNSKISVSNGITNDLFTALNPPTGGIILSPVDGVSEGIQNDPLNPLEERERLLTHIIFSPVLKSANRSLTITYTLTISLARSEQTSGGVGALPPTGGSGSGGTLQAFTCNQTVSSDTWLCEHNLGFFPITRVFVSGVEVQPLEIIHNSIFQTTIVFTEPQVGLARFV